MTDQTKANQGLVVPIVSKLNPLERTVVIGDDDPMIIDVLSKSIESHFGKKYKLNIETYLTGQQVYERLLKCRLSHLTYFIDSLVVDGSMDNGGGHNGPALLKLAEQIFRKEAKCEGNHLYLFTGELGKYQNDVSKHINMFQKPNIRDLLFHLNHALATSRKEYV